MPVDGGHHLVRGNAELVRRAVDDALVCLVRHEPVDIRGRCAGRREGVLDHVGDHGDRVLENLAALHAQMADGLGRRRPAVDIELALVAAVRAQMGWSGCRGREAAPGCSCASSTTAPAPSPNSTQVVRSLQSRMREKVSAPITKARLCAPVLAADRRSTDERKDEARTDRLQVEGGALRDAEAGLHRHGGGRKGLVGRGGGEHDQVDGARPRHAHWRARRVRRAAPDPRSSRRAPRCGARGCRCAARSTRRLYPPRGPTHHW